MYWGGCSDRQCPRSCSETTCACTPGSRTPPCPRFRGCRRCSTVWSPRSLPSLYPWAAPSPQCPRPDSACCSDMRLLHSACTTDESRGFTMTFFGFFVWRLGIVYAALSARDCSGFLFTYAHKPDNDTAERSPSFRRTPGSPFARRWCFQENDYASLSGKSGILSNDGGELHVGHFLRRRQTEGLGIRHQGRHLQQRLLSFPNHRR